MADLPDNHAENDPWALLARKTAVRGRVSEIVQRYQLLRYYATSQRRELEGIRSTNDGTLVELRHIEKWAGERENELLNVLTEMDAELQRLTDQLGDKTE